MTDTINIQDEKKMTPVIIANTHIYTLIPHTHTDTLTHNHTHRVAYTRTFIHTHAIIHLHILTHTL